MGWRLRLGISISAEGVNIRASLATAILLGSANMALFAAAQLLPPELFLSFK